MRIIAMGTIIAFALVGCGTKDSGSGSTPSTGDTTDPTTTTGDTTTTGTGGGIALSLVWTDVDSALPEDTDSNFTNDLNCSSDTLDITITDPYGVTAWDFGMVEVGTSGWSGEDCLNGSTGFMFCHSIGASATLTEVCKINEIVEGSTTLFDDSKDNFLTYIIDDMTECFVTGNDVSYYSTLGCTELM